MKGANDDDKADWNALDNFQFNDWSVWRRWENPTLTSLSRPKKDICTGLNHNVQQK